MHLEHHLILIDLARIVPIDVLEGEIVDREVLILHVSHEHDHYSLLKPVQSLHRLQAKENFNDAIFLSGCELRFILL